MDERQARGMEIAAVCKVLRQDDGTWSVPSQSGNGGNGRYTVQTGDDLHCTCPDHETRGCKCKHIYAVEFVIKREVNDDGTETITKTVTMTESVTRPTYPQDWTYFGVF